MMPRFAPLRSECRKAVLSLAACIALALALAPGATAQAVGAPAAPSMTGIILPGHVPTLEASSVLEGPLLGAQTLQLAIALPVQDPAGLDRSLNALYDPASPNYRQYLTPAQFADRFSPTQVQYDAVSAYLQSKGLVVTGTHSNRLLLDVQGDVQTVEAAFGVHPNRYLAPSGREFYAPDTNPATDSSMVDLISGVIGLDDAEVFTHGDGVPSASTSGIGSGPGGGLTPGNIKAAYNLSSVTADGTGQTLAVFELDGYNPADITAYENAFGLRHVPLLPAYVDNYSGSYAAVDEAEVAGDIELQAALAPGATKIIVYEAPNSAQGILDGYNTIASQNAANEISTSWGLSESLSVIINNGSPLIRAEYPIFGQMATQGQTIFSASGDNGAYDVGYNQGLKVRDPASQPYVCAVGGTTLSLGSGGTWASEVTWLGTTAGTYGNNDGGSGGGVSTVWPIPSWQAQPGAAVPASNSAQTLNALNYRNVPDVALDADPNTGYAIYFNGDWGRNPTTNQYAPYGGTSFAAPLWAAFTALVNQQRQANGYSTIGLINRYLYQIGLGAYSSYANDFHDVTTGNNLYDSAGTGYDDATGWGSFNGANLLTNLAGLPTLATIPLPLYRFADAPYGTYYGTSMDEGNGLITGGWTYYGVIGLAYGSQGDRAGLTPLYKLVCQTPNYTDNFFTTDYGEAQTAEAGGYAMQMQPYPNQTQILPQCYVFPDGSRPGTVPVYRGFDQYGHHVFTTTASEAQGWTGGAGNYTNEGIKFYIMAS